MTLLTRLTRFGAVAVLAASSLSLLATNPAGATESGTLTAAANGFTVTYTGVGSNTSGVQMGMFPSGHTCSISDSPPDAAYFMTDVTAAPPPLLFASSPTTFTFGSPIGSIFAGNLQTTSVAAGSYTVCLTSYESPGPVITVLATLDVTIVDPSTTTTTTTVVEEPATPTFTG